MMRTLGRLCVRDRETAGVFFPFTHGLDSGIYEVREILGELSLAYVGQPAMADAWYQGMSANELIHQPSCALTTAEYNSVRKETK